MTRVFIAVYLVEAGLILTAAPWTVWWQVNYFADRLPWLRQLMTTDAMRSLVVVVGILTILVGMMDLWRLFVNRFGRRRAAPDAADS